MIKRIKNYKFQKKSEIRISKFETSNIKRITQNVQRLKKGITLIETTIYLALIGTAFLIIVNFGLIIADFNQSSQVSNEIQQAVIFVNQHLEENIFRADSVDNINSVLNTDFSTLYLDDGLDSLHYEIENNKLVFYENAASSYLTYGDTEITKFRVEPVDFGDTEIFALRITVELKFNKNEIITETFTNIYNVD